MCEQQEEYRSYVKSVLYLKFFISSQVVLQLCAPFVVEPLDVTSSPRSQVHLFVSLRSSHPFFSIPHLFFVPLSLSAGLYLIAEEYEGFKPFTFCLLPLLLILLPSLPHFFPASSAYHLSLTHLSKLI